MLKISLCKNRFFEQLQNIRINFYSIFCRTIYLTVLAQCISLGDVNLLVHLNDSGFLEVLTNGNFQNTPGLNLKNLVQREIQLHLEQIILIFWLDEPESCVR